jgi:hypothetical protein
VKTKRANLDNLEVVKYLSNVFADHHVIIGILSIQVFPVRTIGVCFNITPDDLEVFL